MKLERLLKIVLWLLQHECATARQLADLFGVSVRTIQRDMVSISLAGIPVYATGGRRGGYAILPEYRMGSRDMEPADYQLIARALQSLATSYSSETLETLWQRYQALAGAQDDLPVYWDFGVTKENRQVQQDRLLLQKAIAGNRLVSFDYRNAEGRLSHRTVQPLAVHYRWYAWYLFAYSQPDDGYRTFKIARMSQLCPAGAAAQREHGDIPARMREAEQAYYRSCITIELRCRAEALALMKEYFPDAPIEPLAQDEYRVLLRVPRQERLWRALLLSFGSQVQVISPTDYREELAKTARDFLSNCDS